jgi:ribosomal protein L18
VLPSAGKTLLFLIFVILNHSESKAISAEMSLRHEGRKLLSWEGNTVHISVGALGPKNLGTDLRKVAVPGPVQSATLARLLVDSTDGLCFADLADLVQMPEEAALGSGGGAPVRNGSEQPDKRVALYLLILHSGNMLYALPQEDSSENCAEPGTHDFGSATEIALPFEACEILPLDRGVILVAAPNTKGSIIGGAPHCCWYSLFSLHAPPTPIWVAFPRGDSEFEGTTNDRSHRGGFHPSVAAAVQVDPSETFLRLMSPDSASQLVPFSFSPESSYLLTFNQRTGKHSMWSIAFTRAQGARAALTARWTASSLAQEKVMDEDGSLLMKEPPTDELRRRRTPATTTPGPTSVSNNRSNPFGTPSNHTVLSGYSHASQAAANDVAAAESLLSVIPEGSSLQDMAYDDALRYASALSKQANRRTSGQARPGGNAAISPFSPLLSAMMGNVSAVSPATTTNGVSSTTAKKQQTPLLMGRAADVEPARTPSSERRGGAPSTPPHTGPTPASAMQRLALGSASARSVSASSSSSAAAAGGVQLPKSPIRSPLTAISERMRSLNINSKRSSPLNPAAGGSSAGGTAATASSSTAVAAPKSTGDGKALKKGKGGGTKAATTAAASGNMLVDNSNEAAFMTQQPFPDGAFGAFNAASTAEGDSNKPLAWLKGGNSSINKQRGCGGGTGGVVADWFPTTIEPADFEEELAGLLAVPSSLPSAVDDEEEPAGSSYDQLLLFSFTLDAADCVLVRVWEEEEEQIRPYARHFLMSSFSSSAALLHLFNPGSNLSSLEISHSKTSSLVRESITNLLQQLGLLLPLQSDADENEGALAWPSPCVRQLPSSMPLSSSSSTAASLAGLRLLDVVPFASDNTDGALPAPLAGFAGSTVLTLVAPGSGSSAATAIPLAEHSLLRASGDGNSGGSITSSSSTPVGEKRSRKVFREATAATKEKAKEDSANQAEVAAELASLRPKDCVVSSSVSSDSLAKGLSLAWLLMGAAQPAEVLGFFPLTGQHETLFTGAAASSSLQLSSGPLGLRLVNSLGGGDSPLFPLELSFLPASIPTSLASYFSDTSNPFNKVLAAVHAASGSIQLSSSSSSSSSLVAAKVALNAAKAAGTIVEALLLASGGQQKGREISVRIGDAEVVFPSAKGPSEVRIKLSPQAAAAPISLPWGRTSPLTLLDVALVVAIASHLSSDGRELAASFNRQLSAGLEEAQLTPSAAVTGSNNAVILMIKALLPLTTATTGNKNQPSSSSSVRSAIDKLLRLAASVVIGGGAASHTTRTEISRLESELASFGFLLPLAPRLLLSLKCALALVRALANGGASPQEASFALVQELALSSSEQRPVVPEVYSLANLAINSVRSSLSSSDAVVTSAKAKYSSSDWAAILEFVGRNDALMNGQTWPMFLSSPLSSSVLIAGHSTSSIGATLLEHLFVPSPSGYGLGVLTVQGITGKPNPDVVTAAAGIHAANMVNRVTATPDCSEGAPPGDDVDGIGATVFILNTRRFPHDSRLRSIARQLQASRPRWLFVDREPEMADPAFIKLQNSSLLWRGRAVMAAGAGRAMFTSSSVFPTFSEPIPVPVLTIASRVPPFGSLAKVDVASISSWSNGIWDWPEFNNGFAAGMRMAVLPPEQRQQLAMLAGGAGGSSLSSSASAAASSSSLSLSTGPTSDRLLQLTPLERSKIRAWIRSHRFTGVPPDLATVAATAAVLNVGQGGSISATAVPPPGASSGIVPPNPSQAGLLFSFGLQGLLDVLSKEDIYEYTRDSHALTTIAVILGTAISRRGTMDATVHKTISLHLPALLSLSSSLPSYITQAPDMEIPCQVQAVSVLALGYLFQESGSRPVSEFLTNLISQEPSIYVDDRDTFSMCAGFALGLVHLGQGIGGIGYSVGAGGKNAGGINAGVARGAPTAGGDVSKARSVFAGGSVYGDHDGLDGTDHTHHSGSGGSVVEPKKARANARAAAKRRSLLHLQQAGERLAPDLVAAANEQDLVEVQQAADRSIAAMAHQQQHQQQKSKEEKQEKERRELLAMTAAKQKKAASQFAEIDAAPGSNGERFDLLAADTEAIRQRDNALIRLLLGGEDKRVRAIQFRRLQESRSDTSNAAVPDAISGYARPVLSWEAERVNTPLTAPAASLALMLSYLQTNDSRIAEVIAIPKNASLQSLDELRFDLVMLRTLGRAVVMWGEHDYDDEYDRIFSYEAWVRRFQRESMNRAAQGPSSSPSIRTPGLHEARARWEQRRRNRIRKWVREQVPLVVRRVMRRLYAQALHLGSGGAAAAMMAKLMMAAGSSATATTATAAAGALGAAPTAAAAAASPSSAAPTSVSALGIGVGLSPASVTGPSSSSSSHHHGLMSSRRAKAAAEGSNPNIVRTPPGIKIDISDGPLDEIDDEHVKTCYIQTVAGACAALGLRYAGTGDPIVRDEILSHLMLLIAMRESASRDSYIFVERVMYGKNIEMQSETTRKARDLANELSLASGISANSTSSSVNFILAGVNRMVLPTHLTDATTDDLISALPDKMPCWPFVVSAGAAAGAEAEATGSVMMIEAADKHAKRIHAHQKQEGLVSASSKPPALPPSKKPLSLAAANMLCPPREVLGSAISTCSLAVAFVMAGTADIDTIRVLRETRRKKDRQAYYGDSLSTGMALGMVALAGGRASLGRNKEQIAALISTIIPVWGHGSASQQYWPQCGRLVWPLAMEHRLVDVVDADTGEPLAGVPITVTVRAGSRHYNDDEEEEEEDGDIDDPDTTRTIRGRSPMLLPEAHTILRIRINPGGSDGRYYPTELVVPQGQQLRATPRVLFVTRVKEDSSSSSGPISADEPNAESFKKLLAPYKSPAHSSGPPPSLSVMALTDAIIERMRANIAAGGMEGKKAALIEAAKAILGEDVVNQQVRGANSSSSTSGGAGAGGSKKATGAAGSSSMELG